MSIILKIKLQDYAGNRTLYKNECDINNKQGLAIIFSHLSAYGLDIRKIGGYIHKYLKEDEIQEFKRKLADEEDQAPWFT